MAVLLNYKICDNSSECGGIEVCPTGAMFWDGTKEKIGIDNNLCISCGSCVGECPVGAIHVAATDDEYESMRTDIERDPRTVEELFVERYGAMPIDEELVLDEEQVEAVTRKEAIVFVEKFQDSSIQCLLHSIPLSLISEKYGGKCVKQQVVDGAEGVYPCLVIYQNGRPVGRVDGYYEEKDMDQLLGEIDKVLK